jgi:hypothetical protein
MKKVVPDHAHKNLGHAHLQKFSKFYFSMIRGETRKKVFPDHAHKLFSRGVLLGGRVGRIHLNRAYSVKTLL